jgi:hypothetical protein
MPAKPSWYTHLDAIVANLQALPRPFVDRATVEVLLGVGRRRAQGIMAPCVTHYVGSNGLVDREVLIGHLRHLAQGEEVFYERTRRRKVAEVVDGLRKERLERPQLLVEAPVRVINQELDDLPAGVAIEVGRITIEFVEPRQALEKLLALAMAIGNNYSRFERRAGPPQPFLPNDAA